MSVMGEIGVGTSKIAESLKAALDHDRQRRQQNAKPQAKLSKKPKRKGPKLSKEHGAMIRQARPNCSPASRSLPPPA